MTPQAPRQLRPYQKEAVEAVTKYWLYHTGDRLTPVVVLPTGTGKSTVIARLADLAASMGLRVVMLAHRAELLDQMIASVEAVAPGKHSTGFVQGQRGGANARIVAASFQTLAANPDRLASLGRRDVVLVDEMHHSAAPSYAQVLADLGIHSRKVVACGFTATASRADGGLGQLWDTVVYEKSLSWAISNGYLIKPRGLTVVLPGLDLSNVAIRGGDYASGELENVMAASVATTVTAMETHAAGRRAIVFAAGVDHADELAAALCARGWPAAVVVGATPVEERRDIYSRFATGDLQAMVTVQVLTEGADFPACDCVVMARPTRSQVLYSQMVGRALRLYDDKTDALVLDLAGTVRDMSLMTVSSLDADIKTARVAADSEKDPGQEEATPARERKQRIGVATLEEIDLLATSSANWLATPGGIRFLDCQGGTYVFLWPPNPTDTASVDVIKVTTPHHATDGYIAQDVDMSAATQAAEQAAATYGVLPDRHAPWRSRPTPSAAQVRLATALGIENADRKTKARLSDDISIHKASFLDRLAS